jgi:hypothetical protein
MTLIVRSACVTNYVYKQNTALRVLLIILWGLLETFVRILWAKQWASQRFKQHLSVWCEVLTAEAIKRI